MVQDISVQIRQHSMGQMMGNWQAINYHSNTQQHYVEIC
jgi:hypothetical protein